MALRVRTEITAVSGSPYLSTFHFPGSGGTDAEAAADGARAFWAEIVASMAAPTSVQVVGEVEEFEPETGNLLAVFQSEQAVLVASGSGDPLPWATQGLIRWRTGAFIDGRELRGRTFIPALTEGHSTQGRPTAALITILNTAAGAVNDLLGVWQRPRLASEGPPVVEARDGQIVPVASFSVWTQWAQLRSRRD
jgi:hypothetical protein